MTPKEKAKELVEKYYQYGFPIEIDRTIYFEVDYQNAKQCALICCDEVLKANHIWYEGTIPYIYWNNVKKQIEKI